MNIVDAAKIAKEASIANAGIAKNIKNKALLLIKKKLIENRELIFKANETDIIRSRSEDLAAPLLKRLKFDKAKLKDVTDGIDSLIKLDDPVGKTLFSTELDEDLTLYKVTCPIGVIGVIFESRPDALVQISTLCLKSGNSVLLKGGREALETNRVLASIISGASAEAGLTKGWIHLLQTRQDVNDMLSLDEYIDLMIPRGSNEFVRYIIDNSRIPVLGHAEGICHCFVDKSADLEMALNIVEDSKVQYVAVCNALETLLVHEDIAKDFLPSIKERFDKNNVAMYGCKKTAQIISVFQADDEQYRTEYLDYAISIKVVSDLMDAIKHINTYGSRHTDVLVTKNKENAVKFMDLVDSGNVFINCSTRFSDGFRYGFGAEVGISTNKIHARGPVGLDGLMIYKYKLIGSGQIVSDYACGKKKFIHKKIQKKYGDEND